VVQEGVRLSGCFRLLFLYDVAEAIDLEMLRNLLDTRAGTSERPFPRRTPQYVRFESAPVVESVGPVPIDKETTATSSFRYYEFGVVVVQLEVPFACDWEMLLSMNSHWLDIVDAGKDIREKARLHLETFARAVTRPTKEWLQETYSIIHIQKIDVDPRQQPTAATLLAENGAELVQLVRVETTRLSDKTIEEALEASVSYYPTDLVVVGSHAAVVWDGSEDAAATMQVLEYAKMQLLEFRYYDRLMTRLLADFYDSVERKRNVVLSRWSLPRDARHFNTVRLDVMELTERIDNAIKFVSDIYYARVYRLAAARVGASEYRKLVDQKLETTGDLYDFMVDQFNDSRSFVLEVFVAILTVLDVIFLLRGK
jgi:hypothetical protein